ncbi:hypothetical protein PRIPAC_80748, partial [Pristionchus pacificus]|uniref:Uncharacterized protein n=1 Tax=Pristionchus pacificus TaxID=54126 RepID=A0A2A6BVI9_PRIPA
MTTGHLSTAGASGHRVNELMFSEMQLPGTKHIWKNLNGSTQIMTQDRGVLMAVGGHTATCNRLGSSFAQPGRRLLSLPLSRLFSNGLKLISLWRPPIPFYSGSIPGRDTALRPTKAPERGIGSDKIT